MADDAFIYGLVDPETGRIRYIGQTVSLSNRLCSHLHRAHSEPLRLWISGLQTKGLAPSLVVLGTCDKSPATDVEGQWRTTLHYIQRDFSLLNIRSSGTGLIWSQPALDCLYLLSIQNGPVVCNGCGRVVEDTKGALCIPMSPAFQWECASCYDDCDNPPWSENEV